MKSISYVLGGLVGTAGRIIVVAALGPMAYGLQARVLEVPGFPATDAFTQTVAAAGYETATIGYGDLVRRGALADADLLVLPKGSALPLDSVSEIEAFLKRGGDLIALDAPLWQVPLVEDAGRWIDRDTYREGHQENLIDATLFDFQSTADIEGWQRSTSNPAFDASHTVVSDSAAHHGSALHVWIEDIDSWDTFISPTLNHPFPDGHDLTVFFAKGDANTPSLSVEWTETDGSRWIATVPLSSEWRCFVLQPTDFKFWESVAARRDTTFNPQQANQLRIGLAFSHTPMPQGEHTYWLGTIGTAQRRPEVEPLLTKFTSPRLEILCPSYKFFPCNEVTGLIRTDSGAALPVPSGAIRSPQPRPSAGGYNKGRPWRFEPLMEARTAGGQWRGTPAALLVHADGPYQGGVWASFGIDDAAWYASPEVLELIGDIAKRMHTGLFLIDGGTAYYTHFPEQSLSAGARVANLASLAHTVNIDLELTTRNGDTRRESATLDLPPMTVERVDVAWPPLTSAQAQAAVRATVSLEGRVIDRVEHDVFLWEPKTTPNYITVENADFMLDGERWRAHGVNYMPSSGIGRDDWYDFEHWIGASAYDPLIIQSDLDHIVDMGLNSVSIFIYHESLEAQNLLDLLRRLDAMGLKANLSLRPGTPLDFEWDKIRALLEHYRIAEHDCVFALDLAWEPMFPDQAGRTRYDEAWRAWIEERYGSIGAAEADWKFDAPRDANGGVTNPADVMLTEDGPWRVMAAAYRRFLDTLLYAHYNKARELVRAVDPHHLVSFRMTEAGDPTFRGTSVLPYDYAYLAAAVDILEPEAYGRIGGWDRVKPALFQAEYGRWAAPDLPFMWAEAGVHVWDPVAEGPLPERLEFQAEYYGHIYRMLIESGADGIYWWWYPGGYRVNERSDYGIIEPDGSDRPVTRVIRERAREYLAGPPQPDPDVWLTMDRDAHPAGVPGIYTALEEEYWRLRDAGHVPGLRTEATGTTSANCPWIAVGNTPCTGSNPPKYLDAYFDSVQHRGPDGMWHDCADGGIVEAGGGTPTRVRCAATNLGEATWMAEGDGAVSLRIEPAGMDIPLPRDVPRFDTVTLEFDVDPGGGEAVHLRFNADGRGAFGMRFDLVQTAAAAR